MLRWCWIEHRRIKDLVDQGTCCENVGGHHRCLRGKNQARLQRHGNRFFPSTTHCLTLASILVLSFLTKNVRGLTISPGTINRWNYYCPTIVIIYVHTYRNGLTQIIQITENINDLHSLSDGSNSLEDYKEHSVDDDEISETTGYQPLGTGKYVTVYILIFKYALI